MLEFSGCTIALWLPPTSIDLLSHLRENHLKSKLVTSFWTPHISSHTVYAISSQKNDLPCFLPMRLCATRFGVLCTFRSSCHAAPLLLSCGLAVLSCWSKKSSILRGKRGWKGGHEVNEVLMKRSWSVNILLCMLHAFMILTCSYFKFEPIQVPSFQLLSPSPFEGLQPSLSPFAKHDLRTFRPS